MRFNCTIVFTMQACGPSPKSKKPPSKPVASSGGGSKKGGEAKKNGKQAGNGDVSEDDSASTSSTPKKGAKDTSRKRKTEETSPAQSATIQESPVCVKRAKTAKDNNRDLGLCRYKPLYLFILVFIYHRSLSKLHKVIKFICNSFLLICTSDEHKVSCESH